jgi:hypothetical protein
MGLLGEQQQQWHLQQQQHWDMQQQSNMQHTLTQAVEQASNSDAI